MFLLLDFVCVTNADDTGSEIFYHGEDGNLDCNITEAKIAWTFSSDLDPANEIEISYMSTLIDRSGKYNITSEGRTLVVSNVDVRDAGIYLCEGPIPKRLQFNVTIQQRPKSNTLSMISINYSVLILTVIISAK